MWKIYKVKANETRIFCWIYFSLQRWCKLRAAHGMSSRELTLPNSKYHSWKARDTSIFTFRMQSGEIKYKPESTVCLHMPVCTYISTVPTSEHFHIPEHRDTVTSTKQHWFKATPLSEWSQQELLFWCPKTVCAARLIQAMLPKHNTRCPYGNVNKNQTYKTLPAITAVIPTQTCYGSNLVPTPLAESALCFHFSTVSLWILTLLTFVSERKRKTGP